MLDLPSAASAAGERLPGTLLAPIPQPAKNVFCVGRNDTQRSRVGQMIVPIAQIVAALSAGLTL